MTLESKTLRQHLLEEQAQIREDLQARAEGRDVNPGIPVGMGIEEVSPSGMPRGVVTVMAGVTGMGKSTVARNMALNSALAGYKGAVFTLEDSAETYRQFVLSSLSGVELWRIHTRYLERSHLARLSDIGDQAADACDRIYIFDAAGLSAAEVVEGYRSVQPDFVWVDYVQILRDVMSAEERIGIRRAMLTFQHAAKGDGVALGVISQVNREVVKNQADPRPRMQHLYGSGAIEQYSKLILGIHYPSRYGVDMADRPSSKHYAEIWFLKNSKGESEVFKPIHWDQPTGKMRSWGAGEGN